MGSARLVVAVCLIFLATEPSLSSVAAAKFEEGFLTKTRFDCPNQSGEHCYPLRIDRNGVTLSTANASRSESLTVRLKEISLKQDGIVVDGASATFDNRTYMTGGAHTVTRSSLLDGHIISRYYNVGQSFIVNTSVVNVEARVIDEATLVYTQSTYPMPLWAGSLQYLLDIRDWPHCTGSIAQCAEHNDRLQIVLEVTTTPRGVTGPSYLHPTLYRLVPGSDLYVQTSELAVVDDDYLMKTTSGPRVTNDEATNTTHVTFTLPHTNRHVKYAVAFHVEAPVEGAFDATEPDPNNGQPTIFGGSPYNEDPGFFGLTDTRTGIVICVLLGLALLGGISFIVYKLITKNNSNSKQSKTQQPEQADASKSDEDTPTTTTTPPTTTTTTGLNASDEAGLGEEVSGLEAGDGSGVDGVDGDEGGNAEVDADGDAVVNGDDQKVQDED